MTRDLSAEFLELDDLPATYGDPVREHLRRTGDREGIVSVDEEPDTAATEEGPAPGHAGARDDEED